MRHRDLHILTVGAYTYTSDQRFTATYHRNTNEWTLQIKFAQKRDAGAYECQVSTQPVKSFSIDLHIVGKWLKINDDNLVKLPYVLCFGFGPGQFFLSTMMLLILSFGYLSVS